MPTTTTRTHLVTVVTSHGATIYPAIQTGAAEAIQQAMALFPGARTVGAKPMRTSSAG
ncbi:MAG: hypothetical protein LBJ15_00805 [Comamonas sp.]|jgi:hypothetical protein|uniref:hypothetical protein n=1 Tax=Comamonas sp. TaxID=34028 RepID=UPI0028396CD8|nr:hypothetical protein [Comamonas sp.]MDR0212526.1 hypothetical protein [Comamonas sp.]